MSPQRSLAVRGCRSRRVEPSGLSSAGAPTAQPREPRYVRFIEHRRLADTVRVIQRAKDRSRASSPRAATGRSPGMQALLALLAVAGIVRIAAGIRSWWDLLDVVVIVAVVGPFFVGIFATISAVQRRRLRRVQRMFPGAQVWLTESPLFDRDLVLADEEIIFTTRDGRLLSRWGRDECRHAVVERSSGFGWPRKWALRLEMGRHRTHETVVLAFPSLFGIWSSKDTALLVRQALTARQEPH